VDLLCRISGTGGTILRVLFYFEEKSSDISVSIMDFSYKMQLEKLILFVQPNNCTFIFNNCAELKDNCAFFNINCTLSLINCTFNQIKEKICTPFFNGVQLLFLTSPAASMRSAAESRFLLVSSLLWLHPRVRWLFLHQSHLLRSCHFSAGRL
jgi:hypothetical protein